MILLDGTVVSVDQADDLVYPQLVPALVPIKTGDRVGKTDRLLVRCGAELGGWYYVCEVQFM